ncbi:MAG: PAS domain S-box protein [Proteobacteria bacterium]|nr:PAS domain S-box protein [Pseudomonadota bacterium]
MTNVEAKVHSYEERYGLLAKQMVDAVWVLDAASMKYVYVSNSVATLRGFTPEEVKNAPIQDHLTPESYKTAMAALMDELKKFERNEAASRTLELELFQKDGSTVWHEVTARLYKEQDGTVRIIGISKDIQERKAFEREKEQLVDRLRTALAEAERLLRENRILRGLLPICSSCKRIRDEDGKWWPVEEYIASRTEADFTHTICPECRTRLYPQFS